VIGVRDSEQVGGERAIGRGHKQHRRWGERGLAGLVAGVLNVGSGGGGPVDRHAHDEVVLLVGGHLHSRGVVRVHIQRAGLAKRSNKTSGM
jgi:hypothetical protein